MMMMMMIVVVIVKPRAVEYSVTAQVLVANLSTQQLGITHMSIHVESVMDKVPLHHFPGNVIPSIFHAYLFFYKRCINLTFDGVVKDDTCKKY